MRDGKFSGQSLALYAGGLIPVIWLALLTAPVIGGGLPGLLANLGTMFDDPLHIAWCEDSLKTVLVFIAAYGLGLGIYLSTDRNYRRREEHGSAKWGSPSAICGKYRGL